MILQVGKVASRQNKTFKYYIIYNYSSKQVINNLLFVFFFACYNMRSIINLIQLSSMFRKLLTVFLIILIIALTVNLFRKDSDFSNSQSALSIQTQQNQTATKSSGVVEIVSPNYTNGSSSTNSISNPTIPITQPITSIDQNNTNNNRQNAGMCKSCSGYDENNKHYWGASYNGGVCVAGESCAGSALTSSGDNTNNNRQNAGMCKSCSGYDENNKHYWGASYNGGVCVAGESCAGSALTSSGDNTNANKAAIDPLIGVMITSSTTIRYGSRGDLVKGLQLFLISKGYLTTNSKVDGVYGRGTLGAVKSFQKDNNLSTDGVVGKKTKLIIESIVYNTSPHLNTLQ